MTRLEADSDEHVVVGSDQLLQPSAQSLRTLFAFALIVAPNDVCAVILVVLAVAVVVVPAVAVAAGADADGEVARRLLCSAVVHAADGDSSI